MCRALLGQKWHSLGDPCVGGESARRTFLAQATFALPVPGLPGRFLLMADCWNPERLDLSRRARAPGHTWVCGALFTTLVFSRGVPLALRRLIRRFLESSHLRILCCFTC